MPRIELVWLTLGPQWVAIAPAGAAASTLISGITPARMTGGATAVSYLALSLPGYGLGPSLVALVSESFFEGPHGTGGRSLAIVSGISLLLAGSFKLVVSQLRKMGEGRLQLDG